METKYTNGPWVVNDVSVRKEDGSLLALVYSNGDGSMNANAHLIAAAPDLYEALDKCIGYVESDIIRRKALKALAKARGETNG